MDQERNRERSPRLEPDGGANKDIAIPAGDPHDGRDFIALHSVQCKQCLDHTDITEDEATVYDWQTDHYNKTDHTEYWHYKIERSRSRLVHPARGHW
jgi:hypothetical protein